MYYNYCMQMIINSMQMINVLTALFVIVECKQEACHA